MRRPAAWAAGIAMVAGAWGAAQLSPPKEAADAPFDVQARIGSSAVGRTFGVTVTDVRVAEEVSMPSSALAPAWKAKGTWVVIDATAWGKGTAPARLLGGATLAFADASYSASERIQGGIIASELVNGVPRSGSLAFQIPASRATQRAVLRLEPVAGVERDSRVVMDLDLGAVPRVAATELRPAAWTVQP